MQLTERLFPPKGNRRCFSNVPNGREGYNLGEARSKRFPFGGQPRETQNPRPKMSNAALTARVAALEATVTSLQSVRRLLDL